MIIRSRDGSKILIDLDEPGNCRSCNEVVFWRLEKSGKRNPYNPPEPCKSCGAAVADCKRCEGGGLMQVSHFATCKQAAQWRKR